MMLRAELRKLHRSSLWLIAIVLPILAVASGAANYALNCDTLHAGWDSYWSQVTLFYGLLFFALAVSLFASASWRMEHQGTNLNLLLTTTRSSWGLAAAKVAAITLAVAVMQIGLAAVAWLVGVSVLYLPGSLSPSQLVSPLVVVVAALPLVSLQSLLSMLMRSFAAPVALCMAGSAVGILSLTGRAPRVLAYLVPQSIATRGINLGSTAMTGSGTVSLPAIVELVVPGLAWAAIIVWFTTMALRFWKRR